MAQTWTLEDLEVKYPYSGDFRRRGAQPVRACPGTGWDAHVAHGPVQVDLLGPGLAPLRRPLPPGFAL